MVQIATKDFKVELREENHWYLFAPIPVKNRKESIERLFGAQM